MYKNKETYHVYKKIINKLIENNDDISIIGIENRICGKLDKFRIYKLYKNSIEQIIDLIKDENLYIFCDEYGEAKFQKEIINSFSSNSISIGFYNSCEIKQIQAADLFCSPIRKHKRNEDGGIYDLFSSKIIVKEQK